jgi:hypothetical protein
MAEFWGSPVYRNYGTLIATGMYAPPGATLALGLKDNRLLLNVASELSVPLPVASLVRDQMLAAIAAGSAELDWSSLTNTALQNAGLTPNEYKGLCCFLELAPQLHFILINGHGDGSFLVAAS